MAPGALVSVKVEGGEALLKALREADGNVKKSLRAASKAGVDVIKADAAARVPPSRYKKVLVSKASSPRKDVVEATVRISKRAWRMRFVEQGVTAHEIKGSPLAFEGDSGIVITGAVRHPGMAARPFLRPAFDAKQKEAEAVVGESLRQAVVEARIAQAAADDED